MNSKGEYNRCRIPRIVIEGTENVIEGGEEWENQAKKSNDIRKKSKVDCEWGEMGYLAVDNPNTKDTVHNKTQLGEPVLGQQVVKNPDSCLNREGRFSIDGGESKTESEEVIKGNVRSGNKDDIVVDRL